MKEFWRGKKVLITGFEGFLGSHLTQNLVSCGARIFGLDRKVRRRRTILTPQDYKRIKVIKGSVADYRLLRDTIKGHKIEIVFHLAAEALVGSGYKAPLRTFESNICGTWCVLEACRTTKSLQAVIVASSDKAYGTHKKLPYKEDYSLLGAHPYDVSKSCADLLAHAYHRTYNLPVAITRCSNIYGPGDFNFSRLVPDAMRCLALNKTLKIRSDGKFIRDYTYIDDIVSGYKKIAELFQKTDLAGEAFNLSHEKPLTVIGLLEKINKLNFAGKKLKYKIMNTCKCEIKKQFLSSSKATGALGWVAKYSLNEGLKKTIEWYSGYFDTGQ